MAAVVCQITYSGKGFTNESGVVSHLVYSFQHANIWHLLCNLLALWLIRNKIDIAPAYCIAFAASYLPMFVVAPTLGLSGLLFAIFGIMWGKTGKAMSALKAGMPTIVITFFLPQVNGLLHLYCYAAGIAYGLLCLSASKIANGVR